LYAGTHFNGRMIMNRYDFTVHMVTNTMDPDEHTVAFDRLKYFMQAMDSTVFINIDEQEACQKYIAAGVNITTMPGEPVDQLVGIMLYNKLNAIMEDRIIVYETELSSLVGDDMVYIHSAEEVTDGLVIPDWWTSPNLIHCDSDILNNQNVVPIHKVDTWRDLMLSWPTDEETPAGGNTIVFADFGKDDSR